jgi:hypothetical protein
MKHKIIKLFALAKQEKVNMCGYPPFYGLQIIPYGNDLYNTYEDAEKALIKFLEKSEYRVDLAATWTYTASIRN